MAAKPHVDASGDINIGRILTVLITVAVLSGGSAVVGVAVLASGDAAQNRRIEALESKISETRDIVIRIENDQKHQKESTDEIKGDLKELLRRLPAR